jgi:hypothetical protein
MLPLGKFIRKVAIVALFSVRDGPLEHPAMTDWQPYREPLRATLTRTLSIALVAGGVAALLSGGGIKRWSLLSLVMLWPAFGGHWIDLLFLNGIRPHLPSTPVVQRLARLAVWFAGGILLAAGARLTAGVLLARTRLSWLTWATAGALFIGVELVAHAALHLRSRPSFYDGRA